MDFEGLRDFLLNRMSMSHIYQPLVIRTLLENGGEASVRHIAQEFLSYDEAQVEYYIRIVKRWPKITLTKHGIIQSDRRGYFQLVLDIDSLSREQRDDLIRICNAKITDYISSYQGLIGDHRYNPEDLSSSSTRYVVLKLANGRCALCGTSIKDTPIDIDHIIPRSQGGSNEIANLQALCYRCNRAKKDRDSQDFRSLGVEQQEAECVFCHVGERVVREYNSALSIYDAYPVTPYHTLILPRRHVRSIDELPLDETSDIWQLAKVIKQDLLQRDSKISGFNIGINDGQAAGQTINHLHLHVIPRRQGDMPDPRGGIRGIIPGQSSYMGW